MLILPAIDLKDGKCVRLRQGRAEDSTVYSNDPVAMARRWVNEGAEYLHVVDLDGAFQGRPVHTDIIAQIAAAVDVPIEIGGGIRTADHVAAALKHGVARVIVGTAVLEKPTEFKDITTQYGAHIAVSIDARDGMVQIKGWVETTSRFVLDLAEEMDKIGVGTIIYTDTASDGMLHGVNAEAVGAICKGVGCRVIAAGGVTSVQDVQALKALACDNLIGVIVGKALYNGNVTLQALMSA
ncbi:MAG: 1-(5-phosphoribosyl)-5-[(5-phosphoribosylamino)methylideneamino]imidazole-4-carboxamide isomerase [Lentisphaerae bacterium]|nr:1-(5-phosphoribosyl)-5-[(5-phosphoribosylamino)methylideneamino]imidazole-4-carboxamide isomerase [Lentisphaerota bacterium]